MIESFWSQAAASVSKQTFGTAASIEQEGQTFFLHDINSGLEVKVISDHIIRLRVAPHGTFLPDFSYGRQDYPFEPAEAELTENESDFHFSLAGLTLTISKDGFKTRFSDEAGNLLAEDDAGAFWEENTDYGGYNVFCQKRISPGEVFYGLGDKAGDLNLTGRRFTLWSTDSYAFERWSDPLYRNFPFYIGLREGRAYGIFFDNTYRSHFDFGTDNSGKLTFWAEGGELNYYLIAGPHMMDVVKRFAHLTGTTPMPPIWALGYHQCRWSYYPESLVRELAKTFREKQIPCDAIYLDIDYMDGYRCFTWNHHYFPDPAKMIGDLDADGFKTVVIIDPGIKVDPDYDVYREGAENGYFCRRGDDYFMEGPVWPGRCQFPDFTNPKVREWWGGLSERLLKVGVAGIWNDMNEPSVFGAGTFPMDVRHNYDGYRGSHRKAHNVYGMQMARATYEGLRKLRPRKRPFVITRSAYPGSQRYASCWTGDNIASWDHLRLANVQCQRLSMSGYSFCGSDIGGFTGTPSAELFTRWIQLGTFHPFMRAHSAGDTPNREPWSYGEPYESINRKYIELRYKLLPYIYSCFWENHRYGFPIVRPVVMAEQEKGENTWRQDEFLFGDKILVCPVLEEGAVGRTIYLPNGKWYYYGRHEILVGGVEEHEIEAPLDTMPIFIRAGAVIPEYPKVQHTGQIHLKEMALTVYYADYPANSFLYEDHGDTFAYEQDIYTEKHFQYDVTPWPAEAPGNETDQRPLHSVKAFSISQHTKGMFTPGYDTYFLRFVGLPWPDGYSVHVDGQPVATETCPDTGLPAVRVFKSFQTIAVSAKRNTPKG